MATVAITYLASKLREGPSNGPSAVWERPAER